MVSKPWKQVLTRGFPSYRAQSNMMVDEATGDQGTRLQDFTTEQNWINNQIDTSTEDKQPHILHEIPKTRVGKRKQEQEGYHDGLDQTRT
jgi:hypothetical protein